MSPTFCSNDGAFGPASGCRTLDFTLVFEASILLLAPTCLFLGIATARLRQLYQATSLLERSIDGLLVVKAFSVVASVAASAALLAEVVIQTRHNAPKLFIASMALEFLSTIPLAVLSYLEHFNSPTPSTIILIYSFLNSVFIGAVLRTFHLTSDISSGLLASAGALTASYGAIFVVELVEKKHLFQEQLKSQYAGESTRSFLSRSAFVWLLPIMWKGRTSRLTLDSLGGVPFADRVENARQPLTEELESLTPAQMARGTMLLRATLKAYTGTMLSPFLPRVVLLAATFAQPYLVERMIEYVQPSTASRYTTQEGWYLVAGFVCIFGVITLSTAVFWQTAYTMTVRYRAAVVGVVYAKSLRLASHASREVGVGGASTIMSVDVERISEGLETIHDFWAAVISIPVATAILYSQAKWAAFAPLLVVALILGFTTLLGQPIGTRQAAWLAATDKRIKLLSSVLANIIPIKLSGYEGPLAQRLLDLRKKEIDQMRNFYDVIIWTAALSNLAATFCGISVLGVYAALSKYSSATKYPLSAAKIFSILTTVNLLNGPLNMIGQGLPSILAAYASLKRIQNFLRMQEKPHAPQQGEATSQSEEKSKSPQIQGVEDFKMEGASFSWLPDSPIILHDIHLLLTLGKLHMCVGPVAAGKTSLLVSMLGETTLRSGSVTSVHTRIAYASQDSFVVVGTCRENITFGQPFEQERYDKVVRACALLTDFERMPSKDQTLLGDKGITLSGGQRQRLALARAVYSGAPLLILDDVLSALDAETEKHVFESLFMPNGLLQHQTVVLATHNIHYLPTADRIIALEDGKIVHQGTYDDLVTSGYDLTGTLTRASSSKEDDAESTNSTVSKNERVDDAERKPNDPSQTDQKDDNEEAKSYDKGGQGTYLFYTRHAGLFRVLSCTILMILYIALRLGVQGFLQEWSLTNGQHLGGWMAGYIAFGIAGLFSGLVAFWSFNRVAIHGGLNVHRVELEALMAAPVTFFLANPAGRLVNRFSSDIFQLDLAWPLAMLNGISSASLLVGTLILVYIATPWLALSAPILAVSYGLLVVFYLATSKQFQQLESASKSPLYTIFANTLGGLESVRAFHAQGHFLTQTDIAINRSQGPFYYRFGGLRFLRTILAFLTGLIAVGIAALAVGLRHKTSAAFLGVALSNVSGMTTYLSNLMMAYSQLENGVVSIRRIHEIANTEPERDPGADSVVIPSKKDLWPQHGSLVFKDVTFQYRHDLPLALKGVSFVVRGGQKIGICGRTGSGKSSTVLSLFRAMDQTLVGGQILLDGVDIATVPLALLRNSISLVSQEPFIWHAPIREILDIDGLHTEQRLWEALDRVGLKQAVADMPDKLDSVIEDGGSLSRGQKQLLCLARVLLRGSRVVVLDEATSSMDMVTDAKIKQVVDTDLADRTIVAVAHRISTIINFDLILVLEDGRVAEFGPPTDLLRNSGSQFAKLAATQGLHGGSAIPIASGSDIQEIRSTIP
ncbi:P-loop containing nucleoside triphosphate hydrolase protein [Clavulina sp. PMI_390]|nr:P-loop containing nucleoside triphosphate hydrolase protein [Clavulina sp. PMI_390]